MKKRWERELWQRFSLWRRVRQSGRTFGEGAPWRLPERKKSGGLLGRLLQGAPGQSIFYIGGSDVLPPPLSAEEEKNLMEQLAHPEAEMVAAARTLLIERNLRLVVYIAKKFENAGVNVEDLISIGTIGLIKAVNTFDPEKNIKLATYASRCIENEILMHLRRSSRQKAEVSLDEPLNVDWDGNELLLSDILGTETDVVYTHLEEEVNHQLLHHALGKLSQREQQIMEMRFGLISGQEMTQKEVADHMGISQSYISRLEKKIIGRLRKEMRKLG
ncbi:MAG: RNA polymerase sporulation sigma factor SigE [Bacillota bacterium]|nr:RNA polymerase sporulation sigma factor SigE [Bacillota bacterium]